MVKFGLEIVNNLLILLSISESFILFERDLKSKVTSTLRAFISQAVVHISDTGAYLEFSLCHCVKS